MKTKYQLIIITLLLFFGGSSYVFCQDNSSTQYCNSKFQFCVSFPKTFVANGESDNGDGQTFSSADGKAKILAFGALVTEPYNNIEDYYQAQKSGYTIAHATKKDDAYIFSGTDVKGNKVFAKIVKTNILYNEQKTDVFQTLEIIYPATEKAAYEDFKNYIKSWSGK